MDTEKLGIHREKLLVPSRGSMIIVYGDLLSIFQNSSLIMLYQESGLISIIRKISFSDARSAAVQKLAGTHLSVS